MLKPSNNIDKELKKVQDKGITNSKNKIIVIVVAIAVTVFLGTTYALFSSDGVLTAFSSKVNKKVTVSFSPIYGTVNSLYGAIIANNSVKPSIPDFTKGEPASSGTNTGSGLYSAEDDDGTTYYFRGNVSNNYVKLDGSSIVWRIVRINGDKTIRLISETSLSSAYNSTIAGLKYVGYTYDNDHVCTKDNPCTASTGTSSTVKLAIESWYNTNLSNYDSIIAYGKYCNDTSYYNKSTSAVWYNGNTRNTNGTATLKCQDTDLTYGGSYKLKVGMITYDEMNYGGIGTTTTSTSANYLYNKNTWMMTPRYSDTGGASMFYSDNGKFSNTWVSNTAKNIYPVINLVHNAVVKSGSGTSSDPYIISNDTNTTRTVNYNDVQTYNVYPDKGFKYTYVSCTNGQSGSYNSSTNKFTIYPKKDTTCTVRYDNKALYGVLFAYNKSISSTPTFTAIEPNNSNYVSGEEVIDTSTSGYYKGTDDYGTSSYFRGAVSNNYVSFAGMIWRAVRINGNNTVRLVLDGATSRLYYNGALKTNMGSKAWFNTTYNANKYVGYMYDSSSNDANATVTKSSTSSTIKTAVDTFYKNYLINYGNYLSDTLFCGDRSISSGTGKGTTTTYYSAYKRRETNSPTLLCSQKNDRYTTNDTTMGNGALTYPIGLLSYDEYVYAGAYYRTKNVNYYLHNDLINTENTAFTMTPAYFSTSNSYSANYYSEPSWTVSEGNLIHGARAVRPVINIKSDVVVKSGNGTSNNPFVLE